MSVNPETHPDEPFTIGPGDYTILIRDPHGRAQVMAAFNPGEPDGPYLSEVFYTLATECEAAEIFDANGLLE